MKKCPIRLDSPTSQTYAVRDGDGNVFGPYRSVTAAKKACGRAAINATILRLRLTVEVEEVTQYKGDKQ